MQKKALKFAYVRKFLYLCSEINRFTMNKTHYLLYLLILFFALSSCTNSNQPQYRIGLSQCYDDAWRQKMNDEMERSLKMEKDWNDGLMSILNYGKPNAEVNKNE